MTNEDYFMSLTICILSSIDEFKRAFTSTSSNFAICTSTSVLGREELVHHFDMVEQSAKASPRWV